MRQKGQVILILILVMTVALAIGLSIVQKSLTDVSTASKVEQSSRAFSAAEAGIEKALSGAGSQTQNFADNSSAILQVQDTGLMPSVPTDSSRQIPLEFPPLAKEDVVQVWLAEPKANLPNCGASDTCYTQTTLDIYWGNSASDKAAIEITLVYYDGTSYQSRKWYLDHLITRTPANGFEQVTCSGYALGANNYQCKKILGASPDAPLPSSGLMLIRARLLYNTTSQPFAVQAVGCCGRNYSLPPQARIIVSTGASGETQRKVQLFQLYKVVPFYFDYAIFSAGDISK